MKQVHWQLPFASLNGTQYRIDIYAEGECATPVQLTGAATPFTTDEDNSDDFFEPVRSQTGVISIVNTSGELSIYDILPADNTDKPVRVVSNGAVVWQGFMSAEHYGQDYTERPAQIDLAVHSVLAAADSVELPMYMATGLTKMFAAVGNSLIIIENEAEMQLFSNIYYPAESRGIFNKSIDMMAYFDIEEQNNENDTVYTTVGRTIKQVLEMVCKFMGWTVREYGTNIYFEQAQTDGAMRRTASRIFAVNGDKDAVNISWEQRQMADLLYKGTGHQRDVRQGARSVDVVASLKPYEFAMSLPETPYPLDRYDNSMGEDEKGNKYYSYLLACRNDDAYSNMQFHYYQLAIDTYPGPDGIVISNPQTTTLDNVINKSWVVDPANSGESDWHKHPTEPGSTNYYTGAFFAKFVAETVEQDKERPQFHDVQDGIYFVMIQSTWAQFANAPSLLKMTGALFRQSSGYLNINTDILWMARFAYTKPQAPYTNYSWTRWVTGEDEPFALGHLGLQMSVRFGNKYWDKSTGAWTTTKTRFYIEATNGNFKKNWEESMGIRETDGYLIPIQGEMSGNIEVELYAWYPGSVGETHYFREFFMQKFSVDYIPIKDDRLSDRQENHFFEKVIGENGETVRFSEKIEYQVELGTDINNDPSPSMIMDNSTTPSKSIYYYKADGTVEQRRPEHDVRRRLIDYYGKARTMVTLEVETQSTPLPLVRVTGYDGKTYLPLSESRDWRADTSTIQCFEVPE